MVFLLLHFPINIQETTMEQSWDNNLGGTLGEPWANFGSGLSERVKQG